MPPKLHHTVHDELITQKARREAQYVYKDSKLLAFFM